MTNSRHGARSPPHFRGAGDAEARRHIPVLLDQVLHALKPVDGGVFLDATFGAGGYSSALLDAAATTVLAIDQDPTAIINGAHLVDRYAPRLTLRPQAFGDLLATAEPMQAQFDGVVFDLGVSSMQLDDAARGFSFQADGPLDMRMFAALGDGEAGTVAPTRAGPSAADVVNFAPEAQIADILFQLGEERRSRAIAAAIVRQRARRPFTETLSLADLVAKVVGKAEPGRHPATRTFQALRIYVNDELGQLARGLSAAEVFLKPGGRLAVVSFHSLEDRIVKRFLARRCGRAAGASRHRPPAVANRDASFRSVNTKAIRPSEQEIAANPRARSARLRVGVRTEASAWAFAPAELGLPQVCDG